MNSLVVLLRKTEGRDKLTKLFVYLLKLLDVVKSFRNKKTTFHFERIAARFQKARQFMRLGKSLLEYQSVLQAITSPTDDEFGRLVRIQLYTLFVCYWALDNLSLLSAFNLLEIPEFELIQASMTIKFVCLAVAALFNVRSWIRLHHAELKARTLLRYLQGEDNLRKSQQLHRLIREQWKMLLLCIKIGADMLPTFAKSAIARKLFNFRIPRVLQALGGMTNAFTACLLTFL